MELLRVIDISRVYMIGDKEFYALYRFSYDFPKSGLVGIIGKSGSGKSTLLNILSLLDSPTSGDIYYGNENIRKLSKKRTNEYRSKDIGIVFQHYNLIESEDVTYNIMLPLLISGTSDKEARKKSNELLESLNFRKGLFKEKVSNLSGGEKERVAILRALINNPKIVLADEPTGALDSYNSEKIMKMLKDISKTKLVIMVTHNVPLIKRYADQLIVLKDGKIIDSYRDNKLFRTLKETNL